MRKFSSFLYKFSTVIMMVVGILAATLWALRTGSELTKVDGWGHPEKAVEATVGFSIAITGLGLIVIFGFLSIFVKKLNFLAKFGKFIIMTIAFILILGTVIDAGMYLGNHSWTKFNNTDEKIAISTFSVGVSLLIMNVVFGILAGILKAVENKKAKKANASQPQA